jgi:NADH:ubiquinone oxidoreductase subunit E
MKPRIKICMGSSCFQRGNKKNLDYIEAYLLEHRCTAVVELVGSRCENACRKGPNLEINGRAYHGVNQEILADLLEQLFEEKPSEPRADAHNKSPVSCHRQGEGFRK